MKKPSDDDGRPPSSAEDNLEEFFSGFLARHPRFFIHVGIGLVLLIILGFIMARISGHGQ